MSIGCLGDTTCRIKIYCWCLGNHTVSNFRAQWPSTNSCRYLYYRSIGQWALPWSIRRVVANGNWDKNRIMNVRPLSGQGGMGGWDVWNCPRRYGMVEHSEDGGISIRNILSISSDLPVNFFFIIIDIDNSHWRWYRISETSTVHPTSSQCSSSEAGCAWSLNHRESLNFLKICAYFPKVKLLHPHSVCSRSRSCTCDSRCREREREFMERYCGWSLHQTNRVVCKEVCRTCWTLSWGKQMTEVCLFLNWTTNQSRMKLGLKYVLQ
jgi:hypothetical protein